MRAPHLLPLLLTTLGLAVSAPAAASAASSCPDADVEPTQATAQVARGAVLCLLNHERTSRGLVALRAQPALTAAATPYAGLMVRQGFFDHVAPDGRDLTARVRSTGYLRGGWSRWSIGENLAFGTGDLATPEQTVAAWMHSAGHRANLLNPAFRDVGIGLGLGIPVRASGARAHARRASARRARTRPRAHAAQAQSPAGATWVTDFGQRTS